MTSFPNVLSVHNVLSDRAASGIVFSPNVPDMSCALKYVPRLTVTRTFSR